MSSALESDRVDRGLWRLAATVVVGALAVVFDSTIISVAVDNLAVKLEASLATIQWVSTAYLLALFVTIPIAGWAQARLGGKRLWLLALGTFLAGSVLCALAWDVFSLIAFRIVQGVGGGIMMPLMITLVVQAAGGRGIGKLIATVTLPTALGPILGPVLGGVILTLGDWRWMFLINIPFCVVGAWLAWRNLPDDHPGAQSSTPRLDVVGLVLVCPGVVGVVYGLSRIGDVAGLLDAGVLIPVVGGLVLICAFVVWGLRRPTTLINLRLFGRRAVSVSSILGFVAAATLFGAMFVLPLYWQQVRGQDALGAGLILVPQGVGALLSRTKVGDWSDRFGPRWVALVGFGLVTLATVPFAFATTGTGTVLLMVALLVRGAGMGSVMIALNGAVYAGASRSEVPDASIIARVAQQVGGSVGTAALAIILANATRGAHSPAALAPGFDRVFWWATALTAVAIPLCLLLPGRIRQP